MISDCDAGKTLESSLDSEELNSSLLATEARDPRKQSRGSDSFYSLAIKVTLSLLPYLMATEV